MATFLAFLAVGSFIALVVFGVQGLRRRRGAARKAWIAGALWLGATVLGGQFKTPDEVTREEARETARTQRAAEVDAAVARMERAAENQAIDETEFILACEQMVRDQLIRPQTARFASFWEMADNAPLIGPETATYRSWVDAKLGSGTQARLNFNCVFRKSTQQMDLSLTR